MKNQRKMIALSALVMLLWGSLFPMIKLAYAAFAIDTENYGSLLLFAGVRFFLCGGVIIGFCAGMRKNLHIVSRKNRLGILGVGITAVFLHYTCTYIGLSMTDSSKTALLKQAGALLFVCFSFVVFPEDRFSIGKVISALLGLIGILALNVDFSNVGKVFSVHFSVGEILILAASVCTVASNVFVKKLTAGVLPIVMTGYSQLIGGALLLTIGVLTGGKPGTLHFASAAIFAYICVASIVSYCLWYYAVLQSDLSLLFMIKFLEPLFSVVLGAAVLGESIFQWSYLAATLAIFAAILVSTVSNRKQRT